MRVHVLVYLRMNSSLLGPSALTSEGTSTAPPSRCRRAATGLSPFPSSRSRTFELRTRARPDREIARSRRIKNGGRRRTADDDRRGRQTGFELDAGHPADREAEPEPTRSASR